MLRAWGTAAVALLVSVSLGAFAADKSRRTEQQ